MRTHCIAASLAFLAGDVRNTVAIENDAGETREFDLKNVRDGNGEAQGKIEDVRWCS